MNVIFGVIKDFIRQARSMFLTCTLVPVVLGGALAFDHQAFIQWPLFFLVLIGVAVAHWGVNLSNDYFDFLSGADRIDHPEKPYSGGGDSLTRDGLDPDKIKLWFWCCFSFALGIGVSIIFLIDSGAWLVMAIMILGFIGGYGYTAPPFKFAYRGLGELDIFLFLGPAPVLGAFAVLTGTLSLKAIVCSMPAAGLICALLWINEYTDFESDKAAGKRNLVVRLGLEKAGWGFALIVLFIYASIIASVILGIVSAWFLIALATLPLAARSVSKALFRYNEPEEVKKAQGDFLLVHLATGLLCSLGVVLG